MTACLDPPERPAAPADRLGDALAAFERILARELPVAGGAGRDGVLQVAARHLCLAPGAKRARPRLCFLFGEVAGAAPAAMVDVAVAVELMHSASLLHDDVVDAGALRRGRPTVNARFGNVVAVLAGDHLLSRAILRLAPHPRAVTTRAVEVVAEMARAAILEVEARRDARLPLEAWREMALGKTGALFGLCGHAAGVLAGDPARAARLEAVGRRLGVAFQLRDDLQDLVSLLEDPFGDIREGNPSYPVLAAAAADPDLRARLEDAWAQGEVPTAVARALGGAVLASPAFDETLDALRREVAAVRAVLTAEPPSRATAELLRWATLLAADPRGGER